MDSFAFWPLHGPDRLAHVADETRLRYSDSRRFFTD